MAEKIKVAQLVLNLELGGLEKLVVNYLAQIDRDAFDITVGCLEHPGALAGEVEQMGIPITSFGRREGIDLGMMTAVARWLRKERANLLHTHNAAAHFYGAFGARMTGVRATIHTKHGRDWPDNPRKVFLNWLSSRFTRKIVTVSQNALHVARDVEKVPEKKLMTIYNGVNTTLFSPHREGETLEHIPGVPDTFKVIGTVARLSPEKDQKTLLRAFELLSRNTKCNCHLVIAGDGPSRAELEALAKTLSFSERITFLGTVNNVPALMKRIDIFILTSLTEGVPLSLLESAASGAPAVVTDVGGNSEVVVDGQTGLVVPPKSPAQVASAIQQIIEDESLLEMMGQRARKRVEEHFSLQSMTDQYESLYRECAGKAIST